MNSESLIRAARDAETPEQLAAVLMEVQCLLRSIEWLRADVARAGVEGRAKGFVTEAARIAGMGHRHLFSLAHYSASVPAQERDPLAAVYKQASDRFHFDWKGKGSVYGTHD